MPAPEPVVCSDHRFAQVGLRDVPPVVEAEPSAPGLAWTGV
jgi:hypothetical protein